MTTRRLTAEVERFPLDRPFRIARGVRTEQIVVRATVSDGDLTGHGECTPYPRYGENPDGVAAQIFAQGPAIAAGMGRDGLLAAMPAGAARNALDCALWDLEAKQAAQATRGLRVWDLARLPQPAPAPSFVTIGIDTPEAMALKAAGAATPRLKVKLGADDDLDADRIAAVRDAAPKSTLIVDANEGWTSETAPGLLAVMSAAGVAMVEQPLPVGQDVVLSGIRAKPPVFADESAHTTADLGALRGRYQGVNIKLDKTGGLTEALQMAAAALEMGFGVMLGCMVSTSLAIAPATLLAGVADFVDLDGPLWLANDRDAALTFDNGMVGAPSAALWG